MKKIISLFQRNYETDGLVRDEIVPGAEWVVAGEGIATRKWDGTCCRMLGGVLWKRYDAKNGKQPPVGFEPAQDPDPVTGHWPGWVRVGDGPEDRHHREALAFHSGRQVLPDGTYELLGPKVNGNHERFGVHFLERHGTEIVGYAPRDFQGLQKFLYTADIEGIVWHHPDGRMVKIKTKDFGIIRAPRGGRPDSEDDGS